MYGADQFGGDQFGGFGGDQFGGDAFAAGGGGGGGFGGNNFGGSQGGGGFMQQNAMAGPVDNSTPEGKAKGDRNRQSLIPVTIKQLKGAPANANGEQGFTLYGRELSQITIVGLIVSADEGSTNLMYTVDDGTDSIMVKMWVDQEQDDAFAERRAQWKEGVVVRVIGQMRAFNNTKSVVAYSITPMADFNEYTYHFLEVMHTHLRFTKGAPHAVASNTYGGAAGGAAASYGQQPAMAAGGGGAMYAQPAAGGAGSLEQLVLSFFQTKGEEDESGCTVAQCVEALQNNGAPADEVRRLVEQLVSDGHLYSTIDDDHFKATGS